MPNQPIPKWEKEFEKEFFWLGRCDEGDTKNYIKDFIRNLLTTAHTEWREQGVKQIIALNVYKETPLSNPLIEKEQVLALPFLQPPKDTV